MTTFFNINDSNAEYDQFIFDDMQLIFNSLEDQHLKAMTDLQAPCIVAGLVVYDPSGNTVKIADDPDDPVSGGVAYDSNGRRIYLPNPVTGVTVEVAEDAINYVCVRHKWSYDGNRTAYKTGQNWYSQRFDDWEVVVRTEAEGIQPGDVCLATTTGTGTTVTISSLNRQQPDYSGGTDLVGPPKVIGITLTTGIEWDLLNDGEKALIVLSQEPQRAWLRVAWTPVTDPSGIKKYEIALVPVDGAGDENPDEVEHYEMGYDRQGA